MTTLTLTDATSPTPVNRSFPLVSTTPEVSKYQDIATNGNLLIGAGIATLGLRETSNGAVRIYGKLSLPTLEQVDGDDSGGYVPPPKKAFDSIGTFELVLPNRASLQNRKDLLAMLKDLIADALVTAAVESFVRPV
jgi:hypothetical protein